MNSLYPSPGSPTGITRKIWRNGISTLSSLTSGAPLVLPSGTYWLEWQSSDTSNGSHFSPMVIVVGSRGLSDWNALAYGTPPSWVSAIDGGIPAAAPDVVQDFPFVIWGRSVAP